MIERLLFSFLVLWSSLSICAQEQLPIGQWADQLSYREVFHVAASEEIAFAACNAGLFSYDLQSQELTRLNKVTGLNDVGASSLAYDDVNGRLIVGYANGNLDIVQGAQIYNLSDIKRSSIIGDLGINEIFLEGNQAWLACGFGIVVIDLDALEVSETFLIGDLGATTRVNSVWVESDFVYAATESGIKKASRLSNLADFANWGDMNTGLNNGSYGQIVRFNDVFLTFSQGESNAIYQYMDEIWSIVDGTIDQDARQLSVRGSNVLFTFKEHFNLRNAELFSISDTWTFNDELLRLNSGILVNSTTMVLGDADFSMLISDDSGTNSVQPGGPYSDNTWQISGHGGDVWVAHGELDGTYNNRYNNDGFSGLDGSDWILKKDHPDLEEVRDIVDVRIDPVDPNKVYMASFLGGLVIYDINSDQIEVENISLGNSPIDLSFSTGRIQTGSLAFDFSGNLWVTNSYTNEGWKVRRRDGSWESIGCPTQLGQTTLYGEMAITESGQTWTVLPRGNGLVVLDHGNEIISTTSHPCKKLTTSVGDGGLPTVQTYCIAEDLDGEIWVGTSDGPVVNYSPQSIMTNNPVDFQPILVERDGNVERLLGSEAITVIAVDGANRKWLGTLTGGIFLLSEDGQDEIHHFTIDNSPLFSNVIKDIDIDPITGAVHIATESGLLTYMGDATLGEDKNECYDVYPNPVRPDYFGPVTIGGLKAESEVKITDVAGNVVFQTVSNGGRAIWQGTNFSGERVSTGVYFALVSDREGESTCISKILFIN